MIEEKRLLISDHCVEDDEFVEEITKKLEQFVEVVFGKEINVEYGVEPWYREEPEFNVEACIQITFNDYEWTNGLGNTMKQTLGIVLEDKGFQAFWIDGKFLKKLVYEQHTEYPLQGEQEICGVKGHDALHKLEEFILTC